jgi:hypothetical protein
MFLGMNTNVEVCASVKFLQLHTVNSKLIVFYELTVEYVESRSEHDVNYKILSTCFLLEVVTVYCKERSRKAILYEADER